MKNCLVKLAFAFALCLCQGFYAVQAQAPQRTEAPLTNSSIIKLVRAGFKEKTVIAIIRTRPASFELSPDRLIELKRGGVSETIILAMLATEGDSASAAADEWGDDPFFNDSGGPRPAGKQRAGNDGGTDIFGISGGSSSRTRQRAGNGTSGGDTQATGSASVRILRPPLEAGAGPKLEKTPTLTNDSIVELVEAGFSEGTIIRRIEQSPAEFDLSPPKLAELRRRRVSDRIIAAMSAVMGDDPAQSAPPAAGKSGQ